MTLSKCNDMKNILLAITALSISASAFAQLQPMNADFENWETLNGSIGNTYDEPVDWNTGNQCSELLNQLAVTSSSDAAMGNSSARLETLPAFGNIRINGVVTTANMICLANAGGQEGGTAFTEALPDSVVGYYKYTPANQDSAYSQVMFLSNNDMDTISFTRYDFTETVTSWTRFSFTITPVTGSTMPEKLSLFFSSSWGDGAAGEAEVGSILFIDGIEFIYNEVSVSEVYNAEGWNVYPNPATDFITIEGEVGNGATIEILDVTGKQVKFEVLNALANRVQTDDLLEGMYLYQITSLDGNILRTGKLLVNQ